MHRSGSWRIQFLAGMFFLFLFVALASCDEYFRLAVQWPPTMSPSHPQVERMRRNRRYTFTIHGLWPESNGRPLQYCSSNFSLDPQTLSNPQLSQYWTSFGAMGNHRFWSHEWQRHGTCASRVMHRQVTPDEYFGMALDAYRVFGEPLDIRLGSYGFKADDSSPYSNPEVKKALRSILRQDATLVCRGRELQEVRFCLNRHLDPVECGFVENRCSGQILLPT